MNETFNNHKELLLSLIEGNVIYNTACEYKVYITDNNLIKEYKDGSINTLNICFNDPTVYTKYTEPNWYDNIPKQGILCWISDVDPNRKNRIAIVAGIHDFIPPRFIEADGTSRRYATPLTNKEIESFIH